MGAGVLDALVINLAGHDDRLAWMQARLAAAHLNMVRVAAVDGRGMSPEALRGLVASPGPPRPLTGPEVGCFQSHRHCWQVLLSGEAPAAIVFEDDLYIAENAATMFSDLSWLPADADFVRLETWRNHVALGDPVTRVAGRGVHRLYSRTFGAAAYIVTRSGASRALALSQPIPATADDFLFNSEFPYFRNFVHYQVAPAPCIQERRVREKPRKFPSSISPVPQRPRRFDKLISETTRIFRHGPRRTAVMLETRLRGRRWMVVEHG